MNDVKVNETLLNFTGTQINYFYYHRQCWFFSHHIDTEHESDVAYLGKIIYETSYNRERREIEINQVKMDFFNVRMGCCMR